MDYVVRESARAKRISITLYPDGRVVATKPKRASMAAVEAFIQSRTDWILTNQARYLKQAGGTPPIALPKPRKGSKAYKEAIASARTLVHDRLAHWSAILRPTYGTVSIRNQTTRWGSCSADNNLSFNYRIAFLPPILVDYIVVHELSHTKEHNHSLRFWALVEKALPDYKKLRGELKTRYLL